MFEIIQAETTEHIAQVRGLFREYAAGLNFDLCFQGFEQELASLPGDYAPPRGRLLLALVDGQPAGCVAFHDVGNAACEMKRLYVRPAFRGQKLGRALAERAIHEADELNYCRMRLDTVAPVMERAVNLYRALGFQEIPPYRPNPIAGAMYMELMFCYRCRD
jgi:putative acetyltransferase